MGRRGTLAALAAVAIAIATPVAAVSANLSTGHAGSHGGPVAHVLLISVDGLHQSDLEWYAQNHPGSELAKLAGGGDEYLHAQTPVPSDSFPGMVGQATGGDPGVTGVYYDVTYNHALLPPGTTSCAGAQQGTEVAYDESKDLDPSSLDAGQGLSGLPGSILQMTASPQSLLEPGSLPVDPSTCTPVYPHQYLKVNTIFEVAHEHGLRTAWSDKHPAYEMLDGPSGTGIDDLFTPEINSEAIGYPAGEDWTNDNQATMRYDSYKAQAVLNEIEGYDHGHTEKVGVPAIFGMNFQTVSTAEKLPSSDGLQGGYLPGTNRPGPLLSRALEYVDGELAAMAGEIEAQGLTGSTAIVLSAKHGQSPQDPNALTRIDDGPIVEGLDAAWEAAHPGAGKLVVGATDDDAMMMWLSDRSPEAAAFARSYLLSHSATGNTAGGAARTLASSGLAHLYTGEAAADYFGVSARDPRHPDVWGIVQHGVVYTGAKKKIAEHGGADPEDRDVPLVVFAPGTLHPHVVGAHVETTQIAPTILGLLGLDPRELEAVQLEGTRPLPAIPRR
jgi:hypothetical protein